MNADIPSHPRARTTVAARAQTTVNDPRWQSVLTRDRQADETFVYSVSTTGVFCRPSCPSRRARPEHIAFHRSATDAEAAGFRACLRCRPSAPSLPQQHAAAVAEACRIIEHAEQPPSLPALARSLGLSPSHLHRLFRAATGLTPKQYAIAHRSNTVRQKLASSHTVTEAIYNAGFNASSRFYSTSHHILGMTPRTFRAGGSHEDIRFALGLTTLGSILIAQSDHGICAILLGDEPELLLHNLEDRFPHANLIAGDSSFETLVAQVVGLVEAPRTGLDLPLDMRGTAFQQRVWQALRRLPVGTRASYTEIAARIGSPRSVRAVAQACAANALAVAIPCHRVVRGDGQLSGYRWGIERKRALLDREAPPADPARVESRYQ